MNIDQVIKELEALKKLGVARVVVCSSDRHFGGNVVEIEHSIAYDDKPGDAVINGDFKNPFTYEEYIAMKSLITVASDWISLDDEPLLNVLSEKAQGWINHYEQQAEDDEE